MKLLYHEGIVPDAVCSHARLCRLRDALKRRTLVLLCMNCNHMLRGNAEFQSCPETTMASAQVWTARKDPSTGSALSSDIFELGSSLYTELPAVRGPRTKKHPTLC